MRLTIKLAAAMTAPLLLTSAVVAAAPAQAAYAPVKAFKDGGAMHKVYAYRGGIGVSALTTSDPAVWPRTSRSCPRSATTLNTKSDRDNDGVACEA